MLHTRGPWPQIRHPPSPRGVRVLRSWRWAMIRANPFPKEPSMAEQTILVCDVCGAPASTTVSIRVEGKTLHKDLCPEHVGELINGTRAARPGRRRSPGPAPKATASKARGKRASKAKAAK